MPPDSPLLATPLGSGLLLAGLFLLGTLLGSFANVVIYRLPLGKSLLWPGSHCPRCGRPIRWHDNVPVLGWLLLGGRCRDCRTPIAVRYPAVETLFGLVLAALGLGRNRRPPRRRSDQRRPGSRRLAALGLSSAFVGHADRRRA